MVSTFACSHWLFSFSYLQMRNSGQAIITFSMIWLCDGSFVPSMAMLRNVRNFIGLFIDFWELYTVCIGHWAYPPTFWSSSRPSLTTVPCIFTLCSPRQLYLYRLISCDYIKVRNHRWKKTYDICLSETGLIHVLWLSLVASFCPNNMTSLSFMFETFHCLCLPYSFIHSSDFCTSIFFYSE